ncbi:MAG: hypothetical protein R2787_16890 [Saprospiraceae bacterium]
MKPQFTALFGLAILLLPVHLVAQAGVCPYSRVNESILVESYWQYRYTLHTGTNQVIHQGGAQFPSYLHFRYDNSAEISTNGQYSQSSWSVNQGRLMLHYRQDSIYCVQRPDQTPAAGFPGAEQPDGLSLCLQPDRCWAVTSSDPGTSCPPFSSERTSPPGPPGRIHPGGPSGADGNGQRLLQVHRPSRSGSKYPVGDNHGGSTVCKRYVTINSEGLN